MSDQIFDKGSTLITPHFRLSAIGDEMTISKSNRPIDRIREAITINMHYPKGIVFKSEADVRLFVSNQFPDAVYWFEQAPGSTAGFPDCMVVHPTSALINFIELKIGELKNGTLKFTVRAEQKRCCRRLLKQDHMPYWLIGIEGTRRAMLLPTNDTTLSGRMEIGR